MSGLCPSTCCLPFQPDGAKETSDAWHFSARTLASLQHEYAGKLQVWVSQQKFAGSQEPLEMGWNSTVLPLRGQHVVSEDSHLIVDWPFWHPNVLHIEGQRKHQQQHPDGARRIAAVACACSTRRAVQSLWGTIRRIGG